MDILLVATELRPYVNQSASAALLDSLTKALRLLGHEVTLALPRYPDFEEAGVLAARRLTPLALPEGRDAHLFEATLPSGAKLALVDLPGERFSTDPSDASLEGFCDAVVAFVTEKVERDQPLSVVHAFGSRAGVVLPKLRLALGSDVPLVMTLSTAADHAAALGRGLSFSEVDVLLTPSPSLAKVIADRESGRDVLGIVGGVEASIFNPATDSALACRYDAQEASNKGRNKAAVLQELGLELDPSRPLVFFEGEATGAGVGTFAASVVDLTRQGVTVVFSAGRPLTEFESAPLEALRELVRVVTPDARLRRRLLAAADFYLALPVECPDAQSLLEAQRYGAVPIALRVGATPDVVVDVDAELATGTGFLFSELDSRSLVAVVGRAVAAYRNRAFSKLLYRVLRQDLAWDRPARRHVQVYRQAREQRAR